MPHYQRPTDDVEREPITFDIRGIKLTAPSQAPYGTLELMAPAAGDGPMASKAVIVPQVLRKAFGDQLDDADGLTDDDGLWLFQRLSEAWFGSPTRPSSLSLGGDGITGSASTPNSSEADTTPPSFTIGSGSPLPSPR